MACGRCSIRVDITGTNRRSQEPLVERILLDPPRELELAPEFASDAGLDPPDLDLDPPSLCDLPPGEEPGVHFVGELPR